MAEELAQGSSATLRNATGTGDYLTRIAGQKSPEGLFNEQVNLLRGEREAEGEIIRGQQRAKEAQAAGEVELAGQVRDKATGLMGEYKESLKPYQEFIPTQNTVSDLIGIFGLMSFIGSSGGGEGKFAGINALGNMGAAMQGYRMGKKDLFEKEMKEFEKNFNSTKAFNEQQRELLRQGMESLAFDKELGLAQIRQAAARESGSVVDALIRKGQFEDAFKLADSRMKALNDIEMKRMALQAQAQKQATAGLKPGAEVTKNYLGMTQMISDMNSLQNQLKDPELRKLIKDYRAEAFLSEEGGKIAAQLLQTEIPAKLREFLTTSNALRNNYYLSISGKAVTGGEAMRNYGVVIQPGDDPAQMDTKIGGMIGRLNQGVDYARKLYNLPDLRGQTTFDPNFNIQNIPVEDTAQPSTESIATEAAKRFGSYEPEKYNYGYENGKFYREKK